jgi:hypothetical protein
MSHQQRSQHQHQQHDQHRQPRPDRQQPAYSQEARREFLWRERVKLEMQVQAVIAQSQRLSQEWQLLHYRKASIEQEKPKLAGQIILSGLAGMRHLPAERLHQYKRERILQEEARLQQAMLQCESDRAALFAQIEVINVELSLLS